MVAGGQLTEPTTLIRQNATVTTVVDNRESNGAAGNEVRNSTTFLVVPRNSASPGLVPFRSTTLPVFWLLLYICPLQMAIPIAILRTVGGVWTSWPNTGPAVGGEPESKQESTTERPRV